jgi:hypothetical protein
MSISPPLRIHNSILCIYEYIIPLYLYPLALRYYYIILIVDLVYKVYKTHKKTYRYFVEKIKMDIYHIYIEDHIK